MISQNTDPSSWDSLHVYEDFCLMICDVMLPIFREEHAGSIFTVYPEDGGSVFLQNIVPDYTVSLLRRQ
jgi:hypothetical protein